MKLSGARRAREWRWGRAPSGGASPGRPDRLEDVPKTWILTGSLDNFRATREHGFRVIGAKEGRRGMAEQIEPGDRIVFYVTGRQAFGGIVRVTGEMYEDRAQIWPGKPGKADPYPWRFETEPELVLDEDDFVPAEELAGELEHVRKWPAEHWQLAFQGQLRTVSEADSELLEQRMREAAPTAA
jgi:predicted RNA-binding protein